MNDKELGKALLMLDTTPKLSELDPRNLARNIVSRDRRRIRALACVATFFWVAATAGIVWLCVMYFLMIEPRLIAYSSGRVQLESDWSDWAWAGDVTARTLLVCLVSMLLAAISTVVLILYSRHATLRQINANLCELSEQLSAARSRSEPTAG
jgi:hypothetical protein